MGNYEELKAAVASVIKTNGNQEITGQVLQNTLTTLISQIGVNATFAGIATPSTAPGTPDQNSFYIASKMGAYPNFNGFNNVDGSVYIFVNKNNSWVPYKLDIMSKNRSIFSEDSTSVSIRRIISKGMYVDKLEVENVPGYIGASGLIVNKADSYSSSYVRCIANARYEVYANMLDLASIAFYDANKTFISAVQPNDGFVSRIVTTPNNCSYIRYCTLFGSLADVGIRYAGDDNYIDPYYNDIIINQNVVSNNQINALCELGIYSENLNVRIFPNTDYYRTKRLAALPGTKIDKAHGFSYSNYVYCWFFDNNNNVVGKLKTPNESDVVLELRADNIPANAVYFQANLIASRVKNISRLVTGHYDSDTPYVNWHKEFFNLKESDFKDVGYYINGNGSLIAKPAAVTFLAVTDYIFVPLNMYLTLINPFVVDEAYLCIYDSEFNLVRTVSEAEKDAQGNLTIRLVNNERYIRVTYIRVPAVARILANYNVKDWISFYSGVVFPGDFFMKTDNIVKGYYIGTNGNAIPLSSFSYLDYTELPKDFTFRLPNYLVDLASCAIYNSDKSFSRAILSGSVSGKPYIEVKLTGGEKYVRTSLSGSTENVNIAFGQYLTLTDVVKNPVPDGSVNFDSLDKELQAKIDKPFVMNNILAAFNNIVCVGDSLTYSQVYTTNSNSRQAKRTYPQILAGLCGSTSEGLARSGATAKSCWDEFGEQVESKYNSIGIIYLGTNQGITNTLDTDVVGDDPNNWADNNIGCYCRFVQKMQSLGYKILLLRPYASSGTGNANLANTKRAIDAIGARFKCAVMDAPYNTENKYHYYPDLSGKNMVHYNDLGYAWFANQVILNSGELESSQMSLLIPNA